MTNLVSLSSNGEDLLVKVTAVVAMPLSVMGMKDPEQKIIEAVIDNLKFRLESFGTTQVRQQLAGVDVTEYSNKEERGNFGDRVAP